MLRVGPQVHHRIRNRIKITQANIHNSGDGFAIRHSRRWLMNPSMNSDSGKPMERVLYEVKKVIVGQDHLLERLVVALLSRGHILVEGVPGLAKTLAIKTLAEAIGGEVKGNPLLPGLVPPHVTCPRLYKHKAREFNT